MNNINFNLDIFFIEWKNFIEIKLKIKFNEKIFYILSICKV